ncbi:DNA polymerase III, delta' subunit [Bifidobacterium longum subsp. longum]|nr:DNA polymerase III, delta' subunit [Bifidobacterium longum subsp. longum]
MENRSSITELSVRLNRAGAVTRLDEVAHARKRLAGNGNPLLVFESLFCALIS